MSHEIKTAAANRVWGLLLADRGDEIEEADILAIEREAAEPQHVHVIPTNRLSTSLEAPHEHVCACGFRYFSKDEL